MFDLFRSRDKAVRVMLGGLLLIVALSMLLYLIPGSGMSSGASRNDQIVAEIGGESLTEREVRTELQNRTRNRQLPAEMIQFVVPGFVDQMISERAVAYEAKQLGFEVSDADVANTIRSIPQLNNLTPQQYAETLAQMGTSVPEFENNIRKNSYMLALQNLAMDGIVVTPGEVQQEFARKNEKLKVEYIAFSADKLKSEVNATPEQLQTYFASNRAAFTIPETRTFELLVADPVKIADTLEVPEAQGMQFYNANKDRFRTPERVKVRHILLMTTGKSKEEVAKIEAKAKDVLKQVKAGGDFAALAQKNSEDPGSAKSGGDLGWVVRGQTVKNFENAAFSLKPKEISNLITTEIGFHIIQVLDKQDAHLQSFEEVRPQIAGELKKDTLNDKTRAAADQARAELVKAPGNAQQIATKLNLGYVKVDKAKPGDAMPLIGSDPNVSGTLASMKKGEVSPIMEANTRLVIVVVDDVFPARAAELAEVEPQVRDAYQQKQAATLVTDRSKQAAELLKSNGGDLQATAKSVGAEVKTPDFFTRQGAVEGVGSAAYFTEAFAKPVGSIVGPFGAGSFTVIAKVVAKQEPDPTQIAKEREGIVAQLKSKKAEERNLLFQDSILNKLVQQGKVKIHKDVLNRLLQSYRNT
jgi:peptidyl-prolyl cis-trans isomerase D